MNLVLSLSHLQVRKWHTNELNNCLKITELVGTEAEMGL